LRSFKITDLVEKPKELGENNNLPSKKIIITDDEEHILDVTKMILEEYGYEIITSNSPLNTLDIIKSDKDIDLLLTDIIMPEMNGYELAKLTKQISPNIKIIFMSGFTNNLLFENTMEEEIKFIQKPYKSFELYDKIREVI
jgi:DNA-binding NtrC family response regulator